MSVPQPPSQRRSVPVMPQVNAPTLGQFWRSDSRRAPGIKPVRWPGTLALLIAIAAGFLLFLTAVAGLAAAAIIGLALMPVSAFFVLVAVVAGLGRGRGIWALILLVIALFVFDQTIANAILDLQTPAAGTTAA